MTDFRILLKTSWKIPPSDRSFLARRAIAFWGREIFFDVQGLGKPSFDSNLSKTHHSTRKTLPEPAACQKRSVYLQNILFCRGDIAKQLVEDIRAEGGILTEEDFAEYDVTVNYIQK